MASIISVAEASPKHVVHQAEVMNFARDLFSETYKDIERLIKVFQNGQIEKRHFAKELAWFKKDHTFQEKNDAYIECAVELGAEAIKACLTSKEFLVEDIPYEEIDAIFTISSTGVATPSIEARIMNILPFSEHTKRIPIWGLGCAGGASGLARANEYCLAFPNAKVLVLAIEFCSLTFQRNDFSKSNLVGTSLFADGVACALVTGDEAKPAKLRLKASPRVISTQSTTMKNSIDVMGWDVKDDGLYVIFSRDIPSIVEKWLKPNALEFLQKNNIGLEEITHFIAHPGGRKVIDAYQHALHFEPSMTEISLLVLREYGNMSSCTIFYVLKRFMQKANKGDIGLAAALGPGFSSEMLLLEWS